MRVREGRAQQERARINGALGDDAARVLGDLDVVLHLERRADGPGAEHATEVVVPRQRLVVGQAPVGHPVEPGRIDVGHRPLLEPVQLVGADEMHLPREHRPVAEGA